MKLNFLIIIFLVASFSSCTLKKIRNNNCAENDTNLDVKNPINVGELDDRTCKYTYSEVISNGEKWGKYTIAENSSTDGVNSARMERIFERIKPNNGAYQFFSGLCKIENVSEGKRGTYIIQAKGKHIGHKDVDPAICLISAKKREEKGVIFFDLYSEEITKRGGRLSKGTRQNVKLTTVKKNEVFQLEMKTGFSGRPIHKHYVAIKINGKEHWIDVPNPKSAIETGIRYGAYSVDEGTATIFFKDTFFKNYNGNN